MAKPVPEMQVSPAEDESARRKDVEDRLEDCRARLQSVELLMESSRRDACALALLLLDDAESLREQLSAAAPADLAAGRAGTSIREQLAAARPQFSGADGHGRSGTAGILALRQAISGLSVLAGSAARGRRFGRAAKIRIAAVAAFIVVVTVVPLVMRSVRAGRVADYDAALARGNMHVSKNSHAAAVDAFQEALAAFSGDERSADAWNNMGWSLQQLGRLEEAVEAYRKALLCRPDFHLARNNLDAVERQVELRRSARERAESRPGK